MTFEEYLKTNWERGVIDFKLRCYNDGTFFYIHPDGKDGETPQFEASGNTLIPVGDEDTGEEAYSP